jgi:hypothetical protein
VNENFHEPRIVSNSLAMPIFFLQSHSMPAASVFTIVRSLGAICLFLPELHAGAGAGRLPGQTMANDKGGGLPFTLSSQVLQLERQFAPACSHPRIADTAIVGEPRRLNNGRMMQWSERWTIDRCGVHVHYLVHFDYRGSVGSFKIVPPTS